MILSEQNGEIQDKENINIEMMVSINIRRLLMLMLLMVLMRKGVEGGYRDIGCMLITEMSMKTAKCINMNLVKVPLNVETDVQILHLFKNQITSLEDESFMGLYSLQNLYLTENWISYVSENAFESLQNLQSLYLNSNMLKEVPKRAFKHLKRLRFLDLGHNPISHIRSDDFSFLLNLETLKFENCQISSIDHSSFDWLPHLYELNIVGNRLSELNWRLKTSLKRSSVVRLYNNPWVCDCRLKWLRLAMETIPNWSFGDNSPICHAPSLLSGVYWKHLNAEKFACPSVIITSSELFNNSTNLELIVGSNSSLECKAWGDPIPQISWLKGNNMIATNDYIQEAIHLSKKNTEEDIENGRKGVKSILKLTDFRKSDEDNYKCVAKNSAGRSEVTYRVWASDKKATLANDSTNLKLNLRFEVIVGIVFGCLLLLGCILICLIFALGKQQKAKKIVKRRRSNKKHQQLLYNENEKNFKMVGRKDEWGDKFIDVHLEYEEERKEGNCFENNRNNIPLENSTKNNSLIDIKPNTKSSFRASNNRRFFQQKEKICFSKSKNYLKRKSQNKTNNKPDILKNDNVYGGDTSSSIFNIKHSFSKKPTHKATNSLPYCLNPVCCKHSCQQRTSTTTLSCHTSTPIPSFTTVPSDTNTKDKHCSEFKMTSDTLTNTACVSACVSASTSMSASLLYNFPNVDRVPLKTILKQPSKSFDLKNDKIVCLTAETTLTTPTTTTLTSTNHSSMTNTDIPNSNYPQKSGRPPDIYATLPGRMLIKNNTDAQTASANAVIMNDVSQKIINEKCMTEGPGNNRDISFNQDIKKPVQMIMRDKNDSNKTFITNLNQLPINQGHPLISDASINNTVSYSTYNASTLSPSSCIPLQNHPHHYDDHSHAMIHSLHVSNSYHPLCNANQHTNKSKKHSPSGNYTCTDQSPSIFTHTNQSNKQHYLFLSPQQQAQKHKQLSKHHTSSHDVRQTEARHVNMHKRYDVSSSTSLHEILSPPFKRRSPFYSPQNSNNGKRASKLNHPDFGTAV